MSLNGAARLGSVRNGRPASIGQHGGSRHEGKSGSKDPGRDDTTGNLEARRHLDGPFLSGPSGLKTVTALARRPPQWYGSGMRKSSIAKQLHAGAGSCAALEVGRRVRERRRAIGMTQSELADPLSRGFVSAVENGQALPSLGALWLFAARLGTGVGNLVDGVNGVGTPRYTLPDGRSTAGDRFGGGHQDPTPSRRGWGSRVGCW